MHQSMALKLRYIHALLRTPVESHEARLAPLLAHLRAFPPPVGLRTPSVLHTLTALHTFLNAADADHPLRTRVEAALVPYLDELPNAPVTAAFAAYLAAVTSHAPGAAIHPSACAAVTALLRSDAAFPVMLHAVETARFDAYTRDERLALRAVLRAHAGAPGALRDTVLCA